MIPELMLMTGIPDNFDEMRRKAISQRTIKPPDDKMLEIKKLMDKFKNDTTIQDLEKLGITIKK